MTYVLRGTLHDSVTDRPVAVYFAGLLSPAWPNLTTNPAEATKFMAQGHARSFLRDCKTVIPWMSDFTVAKVPSVTENRD